MRSTLDYQIHASSSRRWFSRIEHRAVLVVIAMGATLLLLSQWVFDKWGFGMLIDAFPNFCDNHPARIGFVAAIVPLYLYLGLLVGMFVDGLVLSINQNWKLASLAWWSFLISILGIYESWCLGWRISGN